MTAYIAVLLLCCVLIIAVCALFVFHRDYELGPLGALGLAMLAIAAFSRMEYLAGSLLDGDDVYMSQRVILAWIGITLFMGQLAWRFLRRVKKREAEWREAR